VARADVGQGRLRGRNQLFRRVRGGLGVATVAANAVFAAITGIPSLGRGVHARAVPQMRVRLPQQFSPPAWWRLVGTGMLIPPSLPDGSSMASWPNQSVGDMFTRRHRPGCC